MERIAIIAALFLWTCGEDETAVPAAAGGPVAVVEASHGGTVVAAGEQQVEVVTQNDGVVQAYVVSPNAPPPEDMRMTVHVTGADRRPHPVLLTYSPSERRYVGRLRRVRVAPGPVEVVLVHDGHRYRGHSPEVVIVEPSPVVVVDHPGRPHVVVAAPAPVVVVNGGKFRGRHDNGLHLGHRGRIRVNGGGHIRGGHIRGGGGHGGRIRIRH